MEDFEEFNGNLKNFESIENAGINTENPAKEKPKYKLNWLNIGIFVAVGIFIMATLFCFVGATSMLFDLL